MFSIGSFDYLSTQGLPYILLAWLGMWLLRSFATLFHEMGHAIVAWLLTSEKVSVCVGLNSAKPFSVGQKDDHSIFLSKRDTRLYPLLRGAFALCPFVYWYYLADLISYPY